MVAQGEDDFIGMLEVLNGGVVWEELVPNKEDRVHEVLELYCSVVVIVLGVFTGSVAEVGTQGDQISNLTGFGVG